MRVLVVEDDERLCDVYREFLLELGHQPLIAHTAEGAVAKLRAEPPGAMLLDIRLPGMSGLELLQLQSTRDLGVPIVVVSGTVSEGEARECLRLGAVDFLGKPVGLDHLRDVLACLEPLAGAERHAADAPPVERRGAARAPIDLPVRVREYGGNQWDATAVDLSERGIKVRASGSVTPASAAKLSFALPEGPHLELTSVLVRASLDDYAFHFVNLLDWQLERLREFLERSVDPRRGAEPHLRVLQSIAQAVGRSLDVDKMLRLALHALTHVTGHETSSLHLLAPDAAALHLRGERGLSAEERQASQVVPVGEGLVGRVAATGRTARVSSPQATVCVPVESRGRIIGALSLRRQTPEPFSDAEVALLEAGANQIGLALDNSRLYGETRRQLADLQEAGAQADEDERRSTLSKLAAGLVHEINNPLTAILAQAELLMTETDPASQSGERLRVIAQETSRAARLLKSVLQLSRPRRFERQRCGLDAELAAVLAILRPQLEWAGIRIVSELEPLPPIQADRDQLRQLLLNLVQNAQQAMAGQPGERVLTVRTRRVEGQARAEVLDTGPGIPQDVLPRLFDAFFTTKPDGEGTGLGLWVSYDIAEQHGGRLRAENRPDGGAAFTLDLPLPG